MAQKIIPFHEVTCVRKAKTAAIFPNAIEIVTGDKKVADLFCTPATSVCISFFNSLLVFPITYLGVECYYASEGCMFCLLSGFFLFPHEYQML